MKKCILHYLFQNHPVATSPPPQYSTSMWHLPLSLSLTEYQSLPIHHAAFTLGSDPPPHSLAL